MARPLRIEFPGALYHLTSRGDGREWIYLEDADRESFLATLGATVGRYNWRVHAYCLMGNHYHLLVEIPEANLSRGMRQLKSRGRGQVLHCHILWGSIGPWRGRFASSFPAPSII